MAQSNYGEFNFRPQWLFKTTLVAQGDDLPQKKEDIIDAKETLANDQARTGVSVEENTFSPFSAAFVKKTQKLTSVVNNRRKEQLRDDDYDEEVKPGWKDTFQRIKTATTEKMSGLFTMNHVHDVSESLQIHVEKLKDEIKDSVDDFGKTMREGIRTVDEMKVLIAQSIPGDATIVDFIGIVSITLYNTVKMPGLLDKISVITQSLLASRIITVTALVDRLAKILVKILTFVSNQTSPKFKSQGEEDYVKLLEKDKFFEDLFQVFVDIMQGFYSDKLVAQGCSIKGFSLKPFITAFKDIHSVGKAIEFIQEVVWKAVAWVYYKIYGVPLFVDSTKALVEECSLWMVEMKSVLDRQKPGYISYDRDFCQLILTTVATGEALEKKSFEQGYDKHNFMSFFKAVEEGKKLRDVCRNIMRSAKARDPPIVIQLSGPPNVGKSTLASMLAHDLSSWFYASQGITKPPPAPLWARFIENEFWDGYKNNFAILYDDYFQYDDIETRSKTALEIIHMDNTAPFQLHMSSIADKDNCYLDSHLIIGTTNDVVTPELNLQNRNAFLRRRDLLLYVDEAKADPADKRPRKITGPIDVYAWGFRSVDPLNEAIPNKNVPEFGYYELVLKIARLIEKKHKGREGVDAYFKESKIIQTMNDMRLPLPDLKTQGDWRVCLETHLMRDLPDTDLKKGQQVVVKLDIQQTKRVFFCRALFPEEVYTDLKNGSTAGPWFHCDESDIVFSRIDNGIYKIVEKFSVLENIDYAMKFDSNDQWMPYKMLMEDTVRGYNESIGFHISNFQKECKDLLEATQKNLMRNPYVLSIIAVLTMIGGALAISKMCGMFDSVEAQGFGQYDKRYADAMNRRRQQPRKQTNLPRGLVKFDPMTGQGHDGTEAVMLSCIENTGKFVIYDDDGLAHSCRYAFLYDRVFITAKHMLLHCTGPQTRIDLLGFNNNEDLSFTYADCDFATKPESDIAFLSLKKNIGKCHKDIRKHFILNEELINVDISEILVMIPKYCDKGWSRQFIQAVNGRMSGHLTYSLGNSSIVVENADSITYKAGTESGDCGSLVGVNNNKVNHKLLGMHIAGCTKTSIGACAIITREDFHNVESMFAQGKDETRNLSKRFDEKLLINIDGEQEPSFEYNEPVKYLGKVDPKLFHRLHGKSSIIPSPMAGIFAEPNTAPAILHTITKDGVRVDPAALALKKVGRETIVDIRDMDLIHQLHAKLIDEIPCPMPPRDLDIMEATNGVSGWKNTASLHMSTSMGFDRQARPRKGKHHFFTQDPVSMHYTPTQETKERVEYLLSRYEQGESGLTVCEFNLKDELRSLEKIEAVNTRFIVSQEGAHLLCGRMRLGAFMEASMVNHLKVRIFLGLDPHSPEWKQMIDSEKTLGIEGLWDIVGDAKNYDWSTQRFVSLSFADFVCDWYRAWCAVFNLTFTRAQERAVRGILADTTTDVHIVLNKDVIELLQAYLSGSFITALMHCINGQIEHRYCFLKAGQKMREFANLFEMTAYAFDVSLNDVTDKMVDEVLYMKTRTDNFNITVSNLDQYYVVNTGGDDFRGAGNRASAFYTFPKLKHEMKINFGRDYTGTDKKDVIGNGHDAYLGSTYLARGFRRANGMIFAPMLLEDIIDQLNWITTKMNAQESMELKCQSALREFFHHGREVFNHWKQAINTQLRVLGYQPVAYTYDLLLQNYLNSKELPTEVAQPKLDLEGVKTTMLFAQGYTSVRDSFYGTFGFEPVHDIKASKMHGHYTCTAIIFGHKCCGIEGTKKKALESAIRAFCKSNNLLGADGVTINPGIFFNEIGISSSGAKWKGRQLIFDAPPTSPIDFEKMELVEADAVLSEKTEELEKMEEKHKDKSLKYTLVPFADRVAKQYKTIDLLSDRVDINDMDMLITRKNLAEIRDIVFHKDRQYAQAMDRLQKLERENRAHQTMIKTMQVQIDKVSVDGISADFQGSVAIQGLEARLSIANQKLSEFLPAIKEKDERIANLAKMNAKLLHDETGMKNAIVNLGGENAAQARALARNREIIRTMREEIIKNTENVVANLVAQGDSPDTTLSDANAASIEVNELTQIRDTAPVIEQKLSKRLQPFYEGTDPYNTSNMDGVLSRMYRIEDVTWTGSDTINTSKALLNFPFALINASANIQDKLSYFQYFRADVELEFKINTTVFHFGTLIGAWLPTNAQGLGSNMKFNNIYTMSSCKSFFISANKGKSVMITIPYISPQPYVTTAQAVINDGYFGTVALRVLNPLLLEGASNTPTVTISVFGRFKNVEIAGPTLNLTTVNIKGRYDELLRKIHIERMKERIKQERQKGLSILEFSDLETQGKDEAPPQGEQKAKSGSGIISGIFKSVGAMATTVGTTGIAGPYSAVATAIGFGASAIGGIAKAFGYNKPISTAAVEPVQLSLVNGLTYGSGLMTTQDLSWNPANGTSNEAKNFGCDRDYHQLVNLFTLPGLFDTWSFTSSSTPGTVIKKYWVNPNTAATSNASTYVMYMNPLSTVAYNFARWRGTIKYFFQIVCSMYTTGRIRIAWHPTHAEIPSSFTEGEGDFISKIIDFKGDTNVSFSVPYLRETMYCPSVDTYSKNDDYSNGAISISIVNVVTSMSSTGSSLVYVNAYIAGHNDMDFVQPLERTQRGVYVRTVLDNQTQSFPTTWVAQGMDGIDDDSVHLDDIFAKEFPTIVPAKTQQVSFVGEGEKVLDILTLNHRFTQNLYFQPTTLSSTWTQFQEDWLVGSSNCSCFAIFSEWFMYHRGSIHWKVLRDYNSANSPAGILQATLSIYNPVTVAFDAPTALVNPWGLNGIVTEDTVYKPALEFKVPWVNRYTFVESVFRRLISAPETCMYARFITTDGTLAATLPVSVWTAIADDYSFGWPAGCPVLTG